MQNKSGVDVYFGWSHFPNPWFVQSEALSLILRKFSVKDRFNTSASSDQLLSYLLISISRLINPANALISNTAFTPGPDLLYRITLTAQAYLSGET